MKPFSVLRRAVEAIMPWPARHQRKAAIRRATLALDEEITEEIAKVSAIAASPPFNPRKE